MPLLLLSVGCNKLFAKDAPAPVAPDATEKTAEPAPEAASDHAREGAHTGAAHGRYAVPFAWEASPEEPLARARTFIGEVLTSNDVFMKQGSAHFTPMLAEEKPRATVLTCSDSRVQPSAWDPTPENDAYTVRNLGNQLATALGSVQYGVERLHTPVLLIIGHTGCEAVQSVLNKADKDKGPISEELAHMKLPERRHGAEAENWDALTLAVVANVDAQVAEAVTRFSSFIQSGDLTVVGAVYDFKDDFEQGHGRLRLVNVNSNVQATRIEAFQKAIKDATKPKPPPPGLRRASEERGAALLDSTGRPLPGGPRAVINGVTVVGSGNFDAVNTGTLRSAPGSTSLIPGTSDLKRAPGYRLTPSAAAPAAPGHAKEPEPAKHGDTPGGHGKKPDPGHD